MTLLATCIVLVAMSHFGGGCAAPHEVLPVSSPKKIYDFAAITPVVNDEIQAGHVPGAVILIGGPDGIYYQKAFGDRSVVPIHTKMETECIFDIASLSKPVSTAACIWILIDRGQLRLDTRVCDILPEFKVHQKDDIQVHHLLSHTSGLPAYTSADGLEKQFGNPCRQQVVRKICSLKPQYKPGEKFQYSCLGYIILGRIVEVVSGYSLDDFARKNLFELLGMKSTGYNPGFNPQIVPTEMRNGDCLLGRVHDPLAELMGGVSGNAGVFSTAEDLSFYCRMLLNGGLLNGRRILSPTAINMLTRAQEHGRAYGFDVNSSYAWIKGDDFSPSAFCHSGYTGTSLVCDPELKVYLIILTNRVHPDGQGAVRNLRKQVANITATQFLHQQEI